MSPDAKFILRSIIAGWGIPLAIVIAMLVVSPDPNRPKDSFPSTSFIPSRITVEQTHGRGGSDAFELWLHDAAGNSYFHRDPKPEPIEALNRRVPRGVELLISYDERFDGNAILDLAIESDPTKPILSYADIMAEFAFKRRVVYTIASIWAAVGTTWLYFVWRAGKESHEDTEATT